MNTTQKIIKYGAIAFAIFLIVAIISGILNIVIGIGSSIFGESPKMDEFKVLEEVTDDKKFTNLTLDIGASEIVIKEGETLKVETNNAFIKVEEKEDELVVKEKNNHAWSFGKDTTELIVYIPADYEFNKVRFNTGAGKITVDSLIADVIDMDLGAGSVRIDSIVARKNFDLDGGAGSITIKNAEVNNADIDIGVGEFEINGLITGKSEIDSGVGKTTINLKGNTDIYKLSLEKGVGGIKVNGEDVANNTVMGSGENYIDIEGGVGSISINFVE